MARGIRIASSSDEGAILEFFTAMVAHRADDEGRHSGRRLHDLMETLFARDVERPTVFAYEAVDGAVQGIAAVREPDEVAGWIASFGGERITVALDTRQDRAGTWRLPVHGWTETAAGTLQDMAQRYEERGLRHLLCTDITRDGMMTGPNLELYRLLRDAVPGLELQASGGVRHLDDVLAAQAQGCAGIVLGRSLLEGKLRLPEALARVAAAAGAR